MKADPVYAILNAKINAKHVGPTYTKEEVDAMVNVIDERLDKLENTEDGNEVRY